MYGISPTDTVGAEFGLTPVMNLTSSLLAVREHKKGEPVGYGGISDQSERYQNWCSRYWLR